jgi:ABC-type transporter Mla subunit MlaD
MNIQPTATIIPFPMARATPPVDAHTRLNRAMENLQASLQEQRTAVAAWRESLDQLKTVTQSIDQGLHTYRDKLGNLQNQVGTLRDNAKQLERWADGVLDIKV